jgi:hypothetical protein
MQIFNFIFNFELNLWNYLAVNCNKGMNYLHLCYLELCYGCLFFVCLFCFEKSTYSNTWILFCCAWKGIHFKAFPEMCMKVLSCNFDSFWFVPLVYLLANTLKKWLLIMSIPDDGYSRDVSCSTQSISTFLFLL